MRCRCGSSYLIPILCVAGIAAVGAAGFRALTGGCGSCDTEAAKPAATLVSTSSEKHCALCPDSATPECSEAMKTACAETGGCSEAKMAACSEAKKAACSESKTACSDAKVACDSAKTDAKVQTVAAEAKGCCKANAEPACKEGKDGCTGNGENGCCGKCADKIAAEKVAQSGDKK